MLLEDVPLSERISMWYQHDGAPPHVSAAVRNHLNDAHPGRWMGRGGPINWPARSPDLTPLDFFLWGHLKTVVYAQQPVDPERLRHNITVACKGITPTMLQRARRAIQWRAEMCVNEEG